MCVDVGDLSGACQRAAGIERVVVDEILVAVPDGVHLGFLVAGQLLAPSLDLLVVELHHVLIHLARGLPVGGQDYPVRRAPEDTVVIGALDHSLGRLAPDERIAVVRPEFLVGLLQSGHVEGILACGRTGHGVRVGHDDEEAVAQLLKIGDEAVLNIVLRVHERSAELLSGHETVFHHEFIDRVLCRRCLFVLLDLHRVAGAEDGVLRHTNEQVAGSTHEVRLGAG